MVYDLEKIDSNNEKIALYDYTSVHDENDFKIYFKGIVKSYNLKKILDDYNISVNSYIVNGNNYYANNVDELIKTYTKNMSLEEKIYYEIYGVVIDGINITCENSEIIKLSKNKKIY